MTRVKRGAIHSKKRKRVLRQAKGYRGGRSRLYTEAKEAVRKALQYSYRDRRTKKREFRRLWITRVNAAARQHGMSYSQLMCGLRRRNVALDRKALADMAVRTPEAFSELVAQAKEEVKE